MRIETPLRLKGGMNSREHWVARSKRVKKEREAVGWLLRQFERPEVPCVFLITRIAPSVGLDPADNLPSSGKSVVDAIADWMGVNDRLSNVVEYRFKNERGGWGVRIETMET